MISGPSQVSGWQHSELHSELHSAARVRRLNALGWCLGWDNVYVLWHGSFKMDMTGPNTCSILRTLQLAFSRCFLLFR
jgi:hypothetical protein